MQGLYDQRHSRGLPATVKTTVDDLPPRQRPLVCFESDAVTAYTKTQHIIQHYVELEELQSHHRYVCPVYPYSTNRWLNRKISTLIPEDTGERGLRTRNGIGRFAVCLRGRIFSSNCVVKCQTACVVMQAAA